MDNKKLGLLDPHVVGGGELELADDGEGLGCRRVGPLGGVVEQHVDHEVAERHLGVHAELVLVAHELEALLPLEQPEGREDLLGVGEREGVAQDVDHARRAGELLAAVAALHPHFLSRSLEIQENNLIL